MAFLHFVSEKFDMTVSLEDCTLLVKLSYKNNDWAPVSLQKFRTLKDMKKGVAVPDDCAESVKNDSGIRKKKRFFWCVIWEREGMNWIDGSWKSGHSSAGEVERRCETMQCMGNRPNIGQACEHDA